MFTPAPWTINIDYMGAPLVIALNRRIARVLYEGGSEDNEVHANARLIAAAPDLLEALQKATSMLHALHVQGKVSGTHLKHTIELVESGNETIQKATEE